MKQICVVILLLVGIMMLTMCENVQKEIKHMKSSAVGLERIVTTAIPNQEVRTWEGKIFIELHSSGQFYAFIIDGQEVKVPTKYTIIEEVK